MLRTVAAIRPLLHIRTIVHCRDVHTTSVVRVKSDSSPFALRIASCLNPSVLSHVHQYGFAIIDGALSGQTHNVPASSPAGDRSPPSSSPLADSLRESIRQLHQSGQTTLNHTHLVIPPSRTNPTATKVLVPKRAIHEMDFSLQPELATDSPWNDFTGGTQSLSALNRFFEKDHRIQFTKQTVKAQVCEGQGGCFPLHFDTDRKIDSRRLTAILYLNPSWSSTLDGGSLRLYPFPHAPIDISPVHDRLVLFDSNKMLHRVLPSAKERVCISLWWWQDEAQWQEQLKECSSDASTFAIQRMEALRSTFPLATPSQLHTLTHLLSPSYRPHVAKLFHAHEWFSSLEQSHGEGEEPVQHMLVRHLDEVEMITRALGGPLNKLGHTRSSATSAMSDHEPWKSWLPIPWSRSPALPQFCRFVEPEEGEHTSPSSSASSNSDARAARIVDWMGLQ